MPITLPASVVPNELIQSAWGNSVVDALEELDDEKLNLTGGTLTGNLLLDDAIVRAGRESGGTQFAALDTSAGNVAYLALFGSATDINTPGTRTGLVGLVGDADVRVWAETGGGNIELRSEGGAIVFQGASAAERVRINSAGLLVNKTSSAGSTTGVEAQLTGRIFSTTDTDVSNLFVNKTGASVASDAVFANFLLASSSIFSIGREGATNDVRVLAEGSLHARSTTGAVIFEPGGTDRARVNSAGFLVNKASSNIATEGFEAQLSGRVFTTVDTNVTNLTWNRTGTGVASAVVYSDFQLSGSSIGSITRNAATSAVLYNTTSDAQLKDILGDVDPVEALTRILALVPKLYRWNDSPDGDPEVGLIAQEAIGLVPYAVSPGRGTFGAEPQIQDGEDADGNPIWVDNPQAFRPMGIDYGRLTPDLIAAIHALAARLDALEAA